MKQTRAHATRADMAKKETAVTEYVKPNDHVTEGHLDNHKISYTILLALPVTLPGGRLS
jgi:acetamidase/formamidase